jgi:hypothetical protein
MRPRTRQHRRVRMPWTGLLVFTVLLIVPGFASAQTYWFETYQRAVEMIDDGQVVQAADLIEHLIVERPHPADRVRLPGNQFLDYLPYYQRARIEMRLGEPARASRSLDLSEAFGAIKRSRRALGELRQLRLRIENAGEGDRAIPVAVLTTVPSRR